MLSHLSPFPAEFLCPFTRRIMEEPVVAFADGCTYEKSALDQAMQQNTVSPTTQKPLARTEYVHNRALKALIERFLEHQQISSKQAVSVFLSTSDTPFEFLCPITLDIMKVPVISLVDGYTYEKSAFLEAFQKKKESAMTRQPLGGSKYILNRVIHQLIERFLKRNGERLKQAVQDGDQGAVKDLLLSTNPDAGLRENTPLFDSTALGDDAIFYELIKAGADLSLKKEGFSILEYLALNVGWSVEIKKRAFALLSSKGCSLPPILQAACLGDAGALQAEIARDAKSIEISDVGQNNAMHYATANNRNDLFPVLLNHNHALMEQKNCNNDTPLLVAAKRGHLDALKSLVDDGADLAAKNNRGDTSMLIAVIGGYVDIVKWLAANHASTLADIKHGASLIFVAIVCNQLNVVEALVKRCPGILAKTNAHGQTPVLFAAGEGRLAIVEWFANNHSSVLTQRVEGHSILLMAAANGQLDIVRWLLENRKSSLLERNAQWQTVFHVAKGDELKAFLRDFEIRHSQLVVRFFFRPDPMPFGIAISPKGSAASNNRAAAGWS